MEHVLAGGLVDVGGQLLDGLLRPLAQSSIGDLAYFALIYDFLHDQIQDFGLGLMERSAGIVGGVALFLLTAWIFFQGLRIVTGQSRDSMMALVMNSLKATLIVSFAITIGVAGSDVHEFLTQDMTASITELVTGEEGAQVKDMIDENLAWMQVGLTSIDVLQIVDDPNLHAEKSQAMFMVGMGTAGPAMVGGAMLLLYEVAMALFVGLGPIFVLCLLFDQTKSLFQRWLMYGIGTMFSMAVLAAMVVIATKTVLAVAEAFWVSSLAGSLLGFGNSQGMRSMALQQGGVGMLLTVILVSTPPMVANFFQGVLGQFSPYATIGGGGGAPAGQRPGESGYRGGGGGRNYSPPATARQDNAADTQGRDRTNAPTLTAGNPAGPYRPSEVVQGDTIKTAPKT
jgi:type IV secretion system protein VirB6